MEISTYQGGQFKIQLKAELYRVTSLVLLQTDHCFTLHKLKLLENQKPQVLNQPFNTTMLSKQFFLCLP